MREKSIDVRLGGFAKFGIVAALALFAFLVRAAVHEDDWLKVETPDKVAPDSAFQVKVTLKKNLGAGENVLLS